MTLYLITCSCGEKPLRAFAGEKVDGVWHSPLGPCYHVDDALAVERAARAKAEAERDRLRDALEGQTQHSIALSHIVEGLRRLALGEQGAFGIRDTKDIAPHHSRLALEAAEAIEKQQARADVLNALAVKEKSRADAATVAFANMQGALTIQAARATAAEARVAELEAKQSEPWCLECEAAEGREAALREVNAKNVTYALNEGLRADAAERRAATEKERADSLMRYRAAVEGFTPPEPPTLREPVEPSGKKIDVSNPYVVGAKGDRIVILGMVRDLSKEDALTLAAWIVAIVGDRESFEVILDAVSNT